MPKIALNPCPKCGAGDTYVRQKRKERVCRKCGAVTPNIEA